MGSERWRNRNLAITLITDPQYLRSRYTALPWTKTWSACWNQQMVPHPHLNLIQRTDSQIRSLTSSIYLSWSRDSSSVRNLKKLELWLRFCSAVPTTPMEEIRRWAQGSVDLFINKVMPGRIVTLTRCKEHKSE